MKKTLTKTTKVIFGGVVFFHLWNFLTFAQTKITFQQKIFVIKSIVPNLKTVGVIGISLTESEIQNYTRAGIALGIKIIIGSPKNLSEVAPVYKRMTKEMKIQVLDIPKVEETTLLTNAFDFLKENTLIDKICLSVPQPTLVSNGAACSIFMEDGKIVAEVNKKIASLLGYEIPNDPDAKILYVAR